MVVKLKKPIEAPVPDGNAFEAPAPIPLEPLTISGVVITRAALVEVLRVYVPGLTDLEVVGDGERFVLNLAPSADR